MNAATPLVEAATRVARLAVRPHVAAVDLQPELAADLHEPLAQLGLFDDDAIAELTMSELLEILWALASECGGSAAYAAVALGGKLLARHHQVDLPTSIWALALWEDSELDLDAPEPSVAATLRNGRLMAKKLSVILAPVADAFAVLCRQERALALAWLSAGAGVQVGPTLGTLGARALPIADADFDVDNDRHVVVTPIDKSDLVQLLGLLGLLIATCAAATADAALAVARAYTAERYQGGVLIREHDAIKLMLERQQAGLAAARATLFAAARNVDAATAGSWAACLAAKRSADAAAVAAALDAVQILGGYGYMRDFGIEKRLRDVISLSLLPADQDRLALLQHSAAD